MIEPVILLTQARAYLSGALALKKLIDSFLEEGDDLVRVVDDLVQRQEDQHERSGLRLMRGAADAHSAENQRDMLLMAVANFNSVLSIAEQNVDRSSGSAGARRRLGLANYFLGQTYFLLREPRLAATHLQEAGDYFAVVAKGLDLQIQVSSLPRILRSTRSRPSQIDLDRRVLEWKSPLGAGPPGFPPARAAVFLGNAAITAASVSEAWWNRSQARRIVREVDAYNALQGPGSCELLWRELESSAGKEALAQLIPSDGANCDQRRDEYREVAERARSLVGLANRRSI